MRFIQILSFGMLIIAALSCSRANKHPSDDPAPSNSGLHGGVGSPENPYRGVSPNEVIGEAITADLLTAGHSYYQDISAFPVHPNAANYVASIGASTPLHANFGTVFQGQPIGFQYVVVPSTQATVKINFVNHNDAHYSEPAYPTIGFPGPVPIPADAPIQGGAAGSDDRDVIVLDRDNWVLYELYRAFPMTDGSWDVTASSRFDLKTGAVGMHVSGSVAAAGLPILAGLVRYEEVAAGVINHAITVIVAKSQAGFVAPAWRSAGSGNHDPNLPPMGLRMRLKANYNVSGFPAGVQVILRAAKKYGLIITDNGGNMFIAGTYDTRWNGNDLNTLRQVLVSDFEIVDTGAVRPGF